MSFFQRHSSPGFERRIALDSQAFSAVLGTIFAAVVCSLVMAVITEPADTVARAPTGNAAVASA